MDPSVKTSLEEINRLAQQMDSSIYLVGGTVRDHLLGKPCSDYDLTACNAPEIARAWAQKVQRTLVPLDETPGRETFRVALHSDLYFDFTTLQGQVIEEDLAQRDFTINAMAISLQDFIEEKENIIDPFDGQDDLQRKFIRVLSKRTFKDDPLRLLRAFRFAATLGFNIELGTTFDQISWKKNRFENVAKERVTHELLLLFGAERSHIHRMYVTGFIDVLFPGIIELVTMPGVQTNSTQWGEALNAFAELENILLQPEDYLEQSTPRIRDYISKNNRYALLKWAALIRPLSSAPDFDLTNNLREFRLSNPDIQFISRTLKFSKIVLSEARSTAGGLKDDSALYQFVQRSGNELLSSLLLSYAVRLGNQEDIKYFVPLIHRILDFYIETYIPAQDRPALLDGDILQSKFHLEPSPRFKFILEKVEEARVLGTIQTKEEAEQLAKKLIASKAELTE